MKIFVTLFVSLFLVVTAFAQSPRMTLVEEATNASCGPCAAQNPTFEHYLSLPYNTARAIPIVYHANWPGRDVMNAAAPAMHNGRVSYYGISGVPTAVVNGVIYTKVNSSYNGAPSDTVAISRAISAAAGMSPVTILVSESFDGVMVTVDLSVSSTTAISNAKLRIAVTEGYHYYASAGTNGETEFPYTVRQMLPDFNGLDLSLNANETKTFTQTFTYNTEWNVSEMYVVAFVQDVGTKNVLQAATDKVNLAVNMSTPSSLINSAANDPGTFAGTVTTPIAGEYTIGIEENVPAGWTMEVKVDNVVVANNGKITLQKDVPVPISASIVPVSTLNRKGEVTVSLKGNFGSSMKKSFRLYGRDITALTFVKDEGNPAIATSYDQAFQQGVVNYAMLDPSDEAMFDMNAFPVVVWEVGKNVLYQEDVAKLKTYIDKGSRLYMIGAEIGWGLADPAAPTSGFYYDTLFLHNYLHAGYAADDNPYGTLNGFAGDPIGDGLSFQITTGVQNQDTPDQLTPILGSVPILYYGTFQNQVAAIRYEDKKNKLVFLGFGIEGIGNYMQRGDLLKRGIAWLMAPTGIEPIATATTTAMKRAFPQPAMDGFTVPLSVASGSRLELALYDMLGRTVRIFANEDVRTGYYELQCNTNGIPSGTYLLKATVDGTASSQMVRIAR